MFSFFSKVVVKTKGNILFVNLLTSALITLISVIGFRFGLCDNVDRVIIGSIMPLVPGILYQWYKRYYEQ